MRVVVICLGLSLLLDLPRGEKHIALVGVEIGVCGDYAGAEK